MNDRYLRSITVGKGKNEKGLTRDTGFDISVRFSYMFPKTVRMTNLMTMAKYKGKLTKRLSRDGKKLMIKLDSHVAWLSDPILDF